MLYLGIDPGVKGAVASSHGWVRSLPIEGGVGDRSLAGRRFFDILCSVGVRERDALVVLERHQVRPRQNVKSVKSGSVIYGGIKSVLQVLEVPFWEISAAEWKKFMGCTSDKKQTIEVAKREFPEDWLQAVGPRGGVDHNKIEALLIARYGEGVVKNKKRES